MTNKQLLVMISAITLLALALAWLLESAQARRFMTDFDRWWETKHADASPE